MEFIKKASGAISEFVKPGSKEDYESMEIAIDAITSVCSEAGFRKKFGFDLYKRLGLDNGSTGNKTIFIEFLSKGVVEKDGAFHFHVEFDFGILGEEDKETISLDLYKLQTIDFRSNSLKTLEEFKENNSTEFYRIMKIIQNLSNRYVIEYTYEGLERLLSKTEDCDKVSEDCDRPSN